MPARPGQQGLARQPAAVVAGLDRHPVSLVRGAQRDAPAGGLPGAVRSRVGIALLALWLAIGAAARGPSPKPLALLASLATRGLWPLAVLARALFGRAARAAHVAAAPQALLYPQCPARHSHLQAALHEPRHRAAAVEHTGHTLLQSAQAADALAAAKARHARVMPISAPTR